MLLRSFGLIVCYSTLILAGRDFYKILGVKKSSTTKEIKSAYRKLAKQLHPDKNVDDPEAESKFQDLGAAYEALSDKEKRSKYDRGGEDALKDEGQGGGGFDPFGGFSDFFGGGFGGGQQRQRGKPQGDHVTMKLDVTLEEVYNGEFIEIVRYKPVAKEAAGKRKCNCREEMQTVQIGPGRYQMIPKKVCEECANVNLVLEERELETEVEQGIPDGFDEAKFHGEGEPEIDGDPGDLQIIYKIVKHDTYERRGNDLYANMTIGLPDAMTGFRSEITQLDGRKLVIKRDEVTWPGMKLRIKGEGMPDYRDNTRVGNLVLTFDVQFPRGKFSQTSEMNDMINELKASGGKEFITPTIYNGLQGF